MKRNRTIIVMFSVMILILTGCPVGIEYPLGNPGQEKIDQRLIGTWKNKKPDAEVQQVIIKAADDYSYAVEILETGSFYQLSTKVLTGYVTHLGGRNFVYFKPEDEAAWYLYCYQADGKNIVSFDVGLKVGGKDAVQSTESFRQEVEASLKKTGCLTDTIVWTKE